MSGASKSAPPNLNLIQGLAGDWDNEWKRLATKNKEHRQFVRSGVAIPAVVAKIFALRTMDSGKPAFSRGFEAFVLHAHGAETEDKEAISKPGQITVVVRYNPKAGSPPPPPSAGDHPTEAYVKSHMAYMFESNELAKLDKIEAGQVVLLKGVNARTYLDKSGQWAVSISVSMIETVHGLRLPSMWPIARGTGTTPLMKSDKVFVEGDKSSRYDRDNAFILSVWAQPSTAEEREERVVRMARERSETRLQNKDWSDQTWASGGDDAARERKMMARLEMGHLQWTEDAEKAAAANESGIATTEVLLGMTLYDEHLRDFGIRDVDTWVAVAPLIFSRISFKAFVYTDAEGTKMNFGGVDSDSRLAFALQFFCLGLIPDITDCYEKIGVPVTADFAVGHQQVSPPGSSGASSGSAAAAGTNEFISTLADVVPVTGAAADPTVAREIIRIANDAIIPKESKPTFRAIINYTPSPAIVKGLASLDAEEGSLLVTALSDNDDSGLGDSEKLANLYAMMATGKMLYIVVFAMCKDMIPTKVRQSRNKDLMAFMLGTAPSGAAAIEAPAAPAPAPAAAAAAPAAPAAAAASSASAGEAADAESRVEEIIADDEDLFDSEGKFGAPSESKKDAKKRLSSKESKRAHKKSRSKAPAEEETG